MTAPELDKCPFCGNADLRPLHFRGSVFCDKCACNGPWSPFFDGDWNTRAAPTLSAALALPNVAALVEAAKDAIYVLEDYNLGSDSPVIFALASALAALEGRK